MAECGLAILGAGIFARTQYLPVLSKLSNKVSLKAIWSRSQEAAEAAALLAKQHFPNVQAKWGDAGLEEILADATIHGVAIVLAAHIQLNFVRKALEHGKHVIQEKPVGSCVSEIKTAIGFYNSMGANSPIWAVAENYRFEAGLIEAAQYVKNIGDMLTVEVAIELPMNSSSPYFSSDWRRDFKGGFILDGGVHFIAALRLITGSEVTHVSAAARHANPLLPPPDNLSALFQLENGCAGVMVISYSCTERKVSWRVLGSKGNVEVKRSVEMGVHGYTVSLNGSVVQHQFFPFCGVERELEAFVTDMSQAVFEGKASKDADQRSNVTEAYHDVAVVEAMLKSSTNTCSHVQVDKMRIE